MCRWRNKWKCNQINGDTLEEFKCFSALLLRSTGVKWASEPIRSEDECVCVRVCVCVCVCVCLPSSLKWTSGQKHISPPPSVSLYELTARLGIKTEALSFLLLRGNTGSFNELSHSTLHSISSEATKHLWTDEQLGGFLCAASVCSLFRLNTSTLISTDCCSQHLHMWRETWGRPSHVKQQNPFRRFNPHTE